MRLLVIALLVAGCGGAARGPARSPVSATRFVNADPVWLVDDRRDVPEEPAAREEVKRLRGFDIAVTRPIDRTFLRPPRRRALGTNSLDEVPSSTWFENRLGIREITPDEVRRGPGDGRGPDRSAPLRVVSAKSSGRIPGFRVEDAAGVQWLVKLEPTGAAAESAADVTSQRLLWLVGYHVPENHVGTIARDEVIAAEDVSDANLDAVFERARPREDGRYRVLFSRLLDGKPIGGAPQEGVREDDPNDTIPHERRRELRGFYVFAAWLQHTDFKEMGTLDMWREDPLDPSRHVVFHHLVDFGNTLGLYAKHVRLDDGHVKKALDVDHVRSLFSLGIWRRPWEGTPDPGIPGVGAFDVEHFDPAHFSPFSPYIPFLEADELDARWAVRLLLRITPEHIRAALEVAEFDDPRAVEYIERVLIGRQKKTARYWYERVSSLDDFAVEGERLCFVDLAAAHDLYEGGARYRGAGYDYAGRHLGAARIAAHGDRLCIDEVPEGAIEDGYTILRLDIAREGKDPPGIEVHLARAPDGTRRIIGVERRVP